MDDEVITPPTRKFILSEPEVVAMLSQTSFPAWSKQRIISLRDHDSNLEAQA